VCGYFLGELFYKCARKVIATTPSPLHKLIRALLFGVRSWFFDVWYEPTTLEELRQALEGFKSLLEEHGIEYLPDSFDCDDFAMSFKVYFALERKKNSVGLALGVIKQNGKVLGGHAWNIAILEDGNLVFIEPQTFETFTGNISPDGFEYELMAVIW